MIHGRMCKRIQCTSNCLYERSTAYFSSTNSNRNNASAIIEEHVGPVVTIGINRPECKNQLDLKSFEELCNALKKFQNNQSAHAAVIYGVGGSFCSGCVADELLDSRKLVSQCSKPIVAGITGFATGFGFELAMLCDLRVMESTAYISLESFPHKMSDIFYQRLVGAVGSSVAMDLTLTGRSVAAKEALAIGLVNRIVQCGTGIGQGYALAKCVGKFPIENLVAAKRAVYSSIEPFKVT